MRFNGDDLTVSEAVVSSAIDSKPSLAAMPASQRVPRPLRSPGPFSFYSPELKPRFQLCPSLLPLPPPGQEDSPDPNLEFRSSKYSRGTRRRYSELCTRLNKHESSAGRPACASYERKSVRRSHASRVEASRGEASRVSCRVVGQGRFLSTPDPPSCSAAKMNEYQRKTIETTVSLGVYLRYEWIT